MDDAHPESRTPIPRARRARPRAVALALAGVQLACWAALVALSPVPAPGGRVPDLVLLLAGASDADLVARGEVWRLLASVFLHADPGHLVVNVGGGLLAALLAAGVFGSARTLLVYLASGLAGTLASVAFGAGPSAGASGAVYGLLGLVVAAAMGRRAGFPARARVALFVFAAAWLAVSLLAGSGSGVDRAAHLGGLCAGAVFGWAFGRDAGVARETPAPAARSVVVPAALLAALATASLVPGVLRLRLDVPIPAATDGYATIGRWQVPVPAGWRPGRLAGGPDGAIGCRTGDGDGRDEDRPETAGLACFRDPYGALLVLGPAGALPGGDADDPARTFAAGARVPATRDEGDTTFRHLALDRDSALVIATWRVLAPSYDGVVKAVADGVAPAAQVTAPARPIP